MVTWFKNQKRNCVGAQPTVLECNEDVKLEETKAFLCPRRISENDCILFLVVIVGYLKRDWCVSLCCKRMFHMLWHSSYLQISAYGYESVYWDCCIVLSLYRPSCWEVDVKKGEKMSENIGDWVNKYLCGSVSMYHMCLSDFLKNKVYVD